MKSQKQMSIKSRNGLYLQTGLAIAAGAIAQQVAVALARRYLPNSSQNTVLAVGTVAGAAAVAVGAGAIMKDKRSVIPAVGGAFAGGAIGLAAAPITRLLSPTTTPQARLAAVRTLQQKAPQGLLSDNYASGFYPQGAVSENFADHPQGIIRDNMMDAPFNRPVV